MKIIDERKRQKNRLKDLLKLCTCFLLTNAHKNVSGIFFILFRSWVVNENVKNECIETSFFYIFINNSRSKQNKRNPGQTFADIGK